MNANDNELRFRGVSRDSDWPTTVVVAFSRPLSDEELRFFYEVCERSAPLMEDRP